ncbi:FhuF 2Fe-2S C-terminal domain [Corynebacterium mustelae]|uniref:FhuF 2Fe-2S C-terminal domain n=1 Tax=Corynebacterium mustelae TaxID=571915 RepID=A0A0G3GYD3_9CORY|nr:(2Fe-2S)-binding protein [Corynebacterium mustelae]AKK05570.1 FhuF 2Fe-2S C-terminal domain [Corynebacterium mustelae]
MHSAIDNHLEHMATHFPRYAPCIQVHNNAAIPPDYLATDNVISAAIAQSTQLFKLDNPRHAAQVWLFSLMGSVAAPAIATMVCTDSCIDMGLDSGILFNRDDGLGYWFGFRPQSDAEGYKESGARLAATLTPIIDCICAVTKMRPAPLWAVVGDGVIQPAVDAGNEEFEQLRAIHIAQQLHLGLAEAAPVKIPQPRFEQIVDGGIVPLVVGEEPDYLLAHRTSCCMIYHGADSNYCTSCPHQPKEQRLAGLVQAAQF